MLDSKLLGRRIRERRMQSGLSQAELAKSLHIQPSTLCEYEAGRITPSLKVFVDMVNGLACTANDLLPDSMNSHQLKPEEVTEERLHSVCQIINSIKD